MLPDFVEQKELELQEAMPEIIAFMEETYYESGFYVPMDNFNGDTGIYCMEYKHNEDSRYTTFAEVEGWIKAIDSFDPERCFDWKIKD